MEKTRTLYRLRKMKNGVLMNLFTLILGVLLFVLLLGFESSILSVMREKATGLLNKNDSMNISVSMSLCDQAFMSLKSAATYAILFSVEGLIMVIFFVRMSSKTWKLSKFSPLMLGFGTLFIFIYYSIVGLILPSNGQFANVEATYSVVRFAGVFLLLISNIFFIYQVFIQVVLEKIDE